MSQSIAEKAREYKRLKDEHDEQAKLLKEIAKEWETCESELLDLFVDEGVQSTKIEGVGLLFMRVKSYLSVNAGNKPQFLEYLRRSGNGGIIKEDVNSATLTAFLSGHLETLIKQATDSGLDPVDARDKTLQYLKEQGASYFTDRGLSFKKA